MSENMEKNVLKAAWLFPDILYLYGERGNIVALTHMADKLGIELDVERIGLDTEHFDPMDYDIIFCQPGEIATFSVVTDYLRPHKEELEHFISDGRVLLVTSTSQGIFGKKLVREDGSVLEGLGITSCEFKEASMIYADDLYYITSFADGEALEIFGSQIRMMDEFSEDEPFGEILYGYGNNGGDTHEGVIKRNSIFTNTTGPILALNPRLTVKILKLCMERRGETVDASGIDFSLADKSLEAKKRYVMGKSTKLTNCPYCKK